MSQDDLAKKVGYGDRNQYRQLNEDGQAKMLDYATDLVSSGRYKKHDYDELGEKDFETA